MNNNLINVVNLVKNFDEQSVIKNISFNVKKNSIVGILGKNGAGKTTLLGMLLGLITPTKGDIFILGKNLKLNNGFTECVRNLRKYRVLRTSCDGFRLIF